MKYRIRSIYNGTVHLGLLRLTLAPSNALSRLMLQGEKPSDQLPVVLIGWHVLTIKKLRKSIFHLSMAMNVRRVFAARINSIGLYAAYKSLASSLKYVLLVGGEKGDKSCVINYPVDWFHQIGNLIKDSSPSSAISSF